MNKIIIRKIIIFSFSFLFIFKLPYFKISFKNKKIYIILQQYQKSIIHIFKQHHHS